MKKIFFLLVVVYLVPIFLGNRNWQYFQTNLATNFLFEYWYLFLISGLIVFTGFWLLAKKAFPVISKPGYQPFFLFASIVFLGGILIGNAGYIKFINNYFGSGEKITINGIVTEKYKTVRRKKEDGRTIEITEVITGTKYVFTVRSGVFISLREGNFFSKEFEKGSLGILFRNER